MKLQLSFDKIVAIDATASNFQLMRLLHNGFLFTFAATLYVTCVHHHSSYIRVSTCLFVQKANKQTNCYEDQSLFMKKVLFTY